MFNLNNNQIYNENYNNQPANYFEYKNQAIEKNNQISNEEIISKFLSRFYEYEDHKEQNPQKDKDVEQMKTYTKLSSEFLKNSKMPNDIKEIITKKLHRNLEKYIEAENNRRKIYRNGIQIACFYIYLCAQESIDKKSRDKIAKEIKAKEIEELYNDFFSLFEELSEGTKKLISKTMDILDVKVPKKKTTPEEIKKEILENLENIKAASDESKILSEIKTLSSEITNLTNKFLNNKVDKNINNKIKSNITSCYEKIEKNPKLKVTITAGVKLIYALLYLRYKDVIKNDNLLKIISENNIEDLMYKYDEIFPQYDNENKNIIKSIKENLIQKDDSLILNIFRYKIEQGSKDFYPSLDISGVFDLKIIKQTFEFYQEKSIEILLSSSLEENMKNNLLNKILDINFPEHNQSRNNDSLLFDDIYKTGKMYAKGMRIICLCLYLNQQQKDRKERNQEMLNKILKYDITKLNDHTDEIFENIENDVKKEIYKKFDFTKVADDNEEENINNINMNYNINYINNNDENINNININNSMNYNMNYINNNYEEEEINNINMNYNINYINDNYEEEGEINNNIINYNINDNEEEEEINNNIINYNINNNEEEENMNNINMNYNMNYINNNYEEEEEINNNIINYNINNNEEEENINNINMDYNINYINNNYEEEEEINNNIINDNINNNEEEENINNINMNYNINYINDNENKNVNNSMNYNIINDNINNNEEEENINNINMNYNINYINNNYEEEEEEINNNMNYINDNENKNVNNSMNYNIINDNINNNEEEEINNNIINDNINNNENKNINNSMNYILYNDEEEEMNNNIINDNINDNEEENDINNNILHNILTESMKSTAFFDE